MSFSMSAAIQHAAPQPPTRVWWSLAHRGHGQPHSPCLASSVTEGKCFKLHLSMNMHEHLCRATMISMIYYHVPVEYHPISSVQSSTSILVSTSHTQTMAQLMPGICINGTNSKRTPKAKRFWKERINASKVYHWSRLQNTCRVNICQSFQ